MEFPALVVLIALIEYMVITIRVGTARAKYDVEPPATHGHPVWERMFRVQQNTLEQLVIFIPALLIFSLFVSPKVGAAIGLLFLVGRPLYFVTYVKDPKSRTAGFLLGFLSNVMLIVGSIGGIILSLI